jgi:hypothetical protein
LKRLLTVAHAVLPRLLSAASLIMAFATTFADGGASPFMAFSNGATCSLCGDQNSNGSSAEGNRSSERLQSQLE